MPGKSNLATCIEIAKLTASLGELAPFPYISTISASVVTLLEIIQVCSCVLPSLTADGIVRVQLGTAMTWKNWGKVLFTP